MSVRLNTRDLGRRAEDRVAAVASRMAAALPALTHGLQDRLADSIPELGGDSLIVDLLGASTTSNIETFLHVTQYGIPIGEVSPPSAAIDYARRLAQRGTSSNALLRAYRLGQREVLDWAYAEIVREEADGEVAFAAIQMLMVATFAYVDHVSEQVVAEYEQERERWLANRNTVRTTTVTRVLAGEQVELVDAEHALGYRLRQTHVGVVLWAVDRESSAQELQRLDELLVSIADSLGCEAQPLFLPQDWSLGWGWIPLGHTAPPIDIDAIDDLVAEAGPGLRVALGVPGSDIAGFRQSQLEAHRAHTVATIAGDRSRRVTPYDHPGVRAATLLAGDLPLTRELVGSALGGLAADNDGARRLRETLLTFLSEKGSYVATARKLHLHKNSVKYRVDKAIEARGRGLDGDALNMELALIATEWLGQSVLPKTLPPAN